MWDFLFERMLRVSTWKAPYRKAFLMLLPLSGLLWILYATLLFGGLAVILLVLLCLEHFKALWAGSPTSR